MNAAAPATKPFNIASGIAEKSLRVLSSQAGVEVLFSTEVASRVQTQAVHGEMTPLEAANRMLDGTALVAKLDSSGGLLVVNRGSPEKNARRAAPMAAGDRPNQNAAREKTPATDKTLQRGKVTGRVFNPATGEYVRNAEVRLRELNRMVHTEGDGTFRLADVPAGEATLIVSFTGYHSTTTVLRVVADRIASCEISLTSLAYGTTTADGAVKLQEFIVSGDREGNAKAIMEQRRSMNIVNSVASDAFGDVSEGNVGEFLKYIPGIELDYVDSQLRAPRLRGMEPQYTSVNIDGVQLANADGLTAFSSAENSSGGQNVRSAGFEQITLANVDAVEISKTLSADMDANAPAGSINFKTKRAFDRKGRRIAWESRLAFNSEEFHLRKNIGPADNKKHKTYPGGSLEYSDVFFGERLGVILNLNSIRLYSSGLSVEMNNPNKQTTATDRRPVVHTRVLTRDAGQITDRFSTGLTIDLKATQNLVLSFGATYNDYFAGAYNRLFSFEPSANNTGPNGRSTIIGSDSLVAFQTSDAGGPSRVIGATNENFDKYTDTWTLIPRLEFRRGNLLVEAKGAYTRAKNTYEIYADGMASVRIGVLTGVNYRMTRSDPYSPAWKITQVSGPDWTDITNWKGNPGLSDTRRFILQERYSGQIDARYDLIRPLPSFIKVGLKTTEMIHQHRQWVPRFNYVGPGGGPAGGWAHFGPSPHRLNMGHTGIEFFSLSGARAQSPAHSNAQAVGAALREHPEWFVATSPTVDDYFNWTVNQNKYFVEEIPAAYILGNTRFKRLQLQAGLRWEVTKVRAKEADPLVKSQMLAAGYPVDGNGRATTLAGIDYQYTTKPRVWRKGEYDNFFPSIGVKYALAEDLFAHVGYNKAISRPPFNSLSGVWSINEEAQRINLPNPDLLPEHSDNYSARISYYLKQVGSLSIGVFQNNIDNLIRSAAFTAEQFGYTGDPIYNNYTFVTVTNGSGARRFRGAEVEYSQQLSFLPGILRGLSVSGSYVRNYASERRAGLVPHRLTGAVGFKYRGLNLRFNASWSDETPWLLDALSFQPAKTMYDVSGGFQLTRRVGLFFSGRNITNEARTIHQWVDASRTSAFLQRHGEWGAAWTFGVKGAF